MSTRHFITAGNCGAQQAGVALPVVLIIMVAMMLIGVTVIRNVTLGEKISGSLRDQQLAFEAAEEALRYCEKHIQGTDSPKFYAAQAGIAVRVGNAGQQNWKSAAKWRDRNYAREVSSSAEGLSRPPSCMIEVLQIGDSTIEKIDDPNLPPLPLPLRVTGRGYGANESTVVVLQSNLRVPAP